MLIITVLSFVEHIWRCRLAYVRKELRGLKRGSDAPRASSPASERRHETIVSSTVAGTMSDVEDEMDVDGGAGTDEVVFTADNANKKGKRTAANLPIEAEDNLPW